MWCASPSGRHCCRHCSRCCPPSYWRGRCIAAVSLVGSGCLGYMRHDVGAAGASSGVRAIYSASMASRACWPRCAVGWVLLQLLALRFTGHFTGAPLFNLPLASRPLLHALENIPVKQRQLAVQLGMNSWQQLRIVEWPALRRQLLPSAALIQLVCCLGLVLLSQQLSRALPVGNTAYHWRNPADSQCGAASSMTC